MMNKHQSIRSWDVLCMNHDLPRNYHSYIATHCMHLVNIYNHILYAQTHIYNRLL